MTDSERQEAIKIIKSECYISDLLDLDRTRMINTALDVAIEALKQTSALDKARVKIASYGSIWVEYIIPGHTDHDIETIVENVLKQAKEQVLAVIDKYRESEDKLDGNPVDIDKAVEHYEGTLEMLKDIGLEVNG